MSPVIRQRIAVVLLSLSAAGFATWQASEGFRASGNQVLACAFLSMNSR